VRYHRGMRLMSAIALAAIAAASPAAHPAAQSATPGGVRTLRVDYFHTGSSTQELFSLDEVVVEPLPWAGPVGRADDSIRYGAYGFDVRDADSSRLLYSRGFGSIFNEWSTTDEATKVTRTFEESVRFPMPSAPVTVAIRRREKGNQWREVWSVRVDPKDIFVNTAMPDPRPGSLIEIEKHGDPTAKVDLLLLGDGYTTGERAKFEADARRLTGVLFTTSPFKEHRNDFNVWGLVPAARESGISRPSLGIHRDSPVRTTYDMFGSERYVLTLDNKAFRRLASYAPYDAVEIVVNSRTYGGGGIYNLYSTVAADNAFAPYVFVHEFGHQFAGLADEYYTSPVAYLPAATREEPWEPNVTALLDPAALKWRDLVAPGTPLPTPWEKTAYEARSRAIQTRRGELRRNQQPEADMEKLFIEERLADEAAFATERYAHTVGAFEGANYEARGYYRPELNCIMFTRIDTFCAVCRRAIERVIDTYAK
jgi:IgA Peptidase M64/Peptidase M64 N-terminus